jgi:hypothetical protein
MSRHLLFRGNDRDPASVEPGAHKIGRVGKFYVSRNSLPSFPDKKVTRYQRVAETQAPQ